MINIRVLLAIVFLEATSRVATQQPTSGLPLNILSLLPYPDPDAQPSWSEGPTLTIAAQIAVNLINSREDILPGYNVELVIGDSGCNLISKAAIATGNRVLSADKPVAGIVGPGCSSSALFIAPLISQDPIGLVSVHIAGSLLLSNRREYPNAFGTLDSTEVFVDTLIALSHRNMWRNVSVMFDESRIYYAGIIHALKERLTLSNGTADVSLSLSTTSGVYDTYLPFEEIQQSGSQITFLLVGPDQLSRIFCFAFHNKLFFSSHQFVVVSRSLNEIRPIEFMYDSVQYSCDEEQVMMAVNRTIIIHYRLDPFNTSAVTDSGLTYDQFIELYPGEVDAYNTNLVDGEEKLESSFWAASYFDAVWSLALALNNSREEIKNRTGMDLSQYRYGDTVATDIIKGNLLQLDYDGVSGRIRFDESSGYVMRIVDIYQVVNNTMTRVEYFNGTNIFQLGNLSLEYIPDTVSLVISRAPLLVGILFMIIALVALALIVSSQVMIIVYRNHHSVKAMSPKLLHVAFVGSYFLNLTCIFYIITESFPVSPGFKCGTFHTLNITAIIGMTLLFGSLSGKTWRIYRIFVHYLNPGILITDRVLFTYIGVLVLVQVPVLVAWVAIEPLSPFVEPFRDQGLFIIRCTTSYYHVWWGSLLVYNYILIFATFFIALRCHGIKQRDFKTNSIIVLVYLLTIVTILGFPAYFLIPISPDILPEFLILNSTILFVLYISIFLHLCVPLWPIIKSKFVSTVQSKPQIRSDEIYCNSEKL